MRVEVIHGREIDASLARDWRRLRDANPTLISPYFSPQYTMQTAQVRDDVFVSVVEEDGRVIGLLPFQRGLSRIGRPVSGPMSDYQGFICAPNTSFDPRAVVKKSGLDMWVFDHLVASQAPFRPHHRQIETSPIMDLSRGFDAYVEDRRATGSQNISRIRRKRRGLQRDVGPVRFERHVTDPAVFEQLIAWKRHQCQTTGTADLFGHHWARELLERIFATQDDDFAGVLSAVWAGDKLAAAHMGMRSAGAWHYWFPSYNRDLHHFSPGLVLLLWMAEDAPKQGLLHIDLGKGEGRYKDRLMNGAIEVAEGRVATPSLTALATEVSERSAAFIRSTPLIRPARIGGKVLRKVRRWIDYR